jgi:hypothetical protein
MTYRDYPCPSCNSEPTHIITPTAGAISVGHRIECTNPVCPNPLKTGTYSRAMKAYDAWIEGTKNDRLASV